MNKVLIITLIGAIHVSSVFSQSCETEEIIASHKEKIVEATKNYFESLNSILDNNTDYEDKEAYIDGARRYFESEDVIIENDNKGIKVDKMKAIDYLNKLAGLYNGQQDMVEVKPSDIQVSNIYKEVSGRNVVSVMVDRVLTITKINKSTEKETDENKKIVFYYATNLPSKTGNFPKTNSSYKIISIQLDKNTNNNSFGTADIIKPCTEEEANSQLDFQKPYLKFDINPVNTYVEIDGEAFSPVKGERYGSASGEKKVKIYASGYEPTTLNITVPDTGTITVRKTLKQIKGTLNISSDPKFYGRMVKVDKKVIGTLPIEDYKLPLGIHRVTVVGDMCYYSKYFSVSITEDDKDKEINITKWVNSGAMVGSITNSIVGGFFGSSAPKINPCEGK